MRKHIPAIIASALVLSVTHTMIAQNSHGEHPPSAGTATSGAASEQEKKHKYTCLMHPEVITDHPGNCPKCGMKLVPLKKDKRPTPNHESEMSHPSHEMHESPHEHEMMPMHSTADLAEPMSREG